MLKDLINYLKCLIFGCEEKSEEQTWLEDKVKEKEQELKGIEDEDSTPSDNIDYLNRD